MLYLNPCQSFVEYIPDWSCLWLARMLGIIEGVKGRSEILRKFIHFGGDRLPLGCLRVLLTPPPRPPLKLYENLSVLERLVSLTKLQKHQILHVKCL